MAESNKMENGNYLELMQSISGYGRELFVSNVIKYIADKYPEQFCMVFAQYLPKGLTKVNVIREKNHIDISVSAHGDDNNPCLIIENKIGAGITVAQLGNYESKVDQNCKCVLLSLRQPNISLPERWEYMNYEQLADNILSNFSADVPSFDYRFIRYFAEYLMSLNEEIGKAQKYVEKNMEVPLEIFMQNINSKRPSILRAVFESLAETLSNRLNDSRVTICASIGHSTPMLDINFYQRENDKIRYIIQLQDNTLVIGFVIDNDGKFIPSKDDKAKLSAQKKMNRKSIWDEYAPEELKKIASEVNAKTGNGYTTDKYIMPTIRLSRGTNSINEIFDEISTYAKIFTQDHASEKNQESTSV